MMQARRLEREPRPQLGSCPGQPGRLCGKHQEESVLSPSLFASLLLRCVYLLRRSFEPTAVAADFLFLSFVAHPEEMPALSVCLQLFLLLSLSFFLSSLLPPQSFPVALELRPSRRRPSPANYGRRRRGGAPGPLVSSRAEAEAFSSSLRLFFSLLTFSGRRRSRHRQVLSHCTDLRLDPHRN